MRRSHKFVTAGALVGVLVCVLLIAAGPAMADGTYHSQHIAFMPVNGAPLKAGFLENIHANGPQIFGRELYVLVGAMPLTQFQGTVQIYLDPRLSQYAGALSTTTFSTNKAGNGVGDFVLPPSGVPAAFRHSTLYLIWQLSVDREVVYETSPSTVTLD